MSHNGLQLVQEQTHWFWTPEITKADALGSLYWLPWQCRNIPKLYTKLPEQPSTLCMGL